MDVKLVMFRSNGQRKDFPIINPVTVIGRAENCDLQVPLLSVSRRHCELNVASDAVTVKDLASSNGTYVNNRRVNEVRLKAGDRLVVGPIVFTIQINGRPEQISAVKTQGQILAEQGRPGLDDLGDIDAEVVATPGASVLAETVAPGLLDEDDEEFDPISALEVDDEERDDYDLKD